MYKIYEKLVAAQRENNESAVSVAAREWLNRETQNPFPVDSPAYELFFKSLVAWKKWLSGSIDARRNKVRAMTYVAQIAAMDLPNPYIKNEQWEVKLPLDASEKEIKVSVETEQSIEPVHILGVIPEEKELEQPVQEVTEPVEVKEETTEVVVEQIALPEDIKETESVTTAAATQKLTNVNNKKHDHGNDKKQFFGKKKK